MFLAYSYLSKFKPPQHDSLTDPKTGWCCLHRYYAVYARILRVRDPGKKNQTPAERDRKPALAVRFGYRQKADAAAPILYRPTRQDVVPVTNCVHDVALHGHDIRLRVPHVHNLPSSIPRPIRFLKWERGIDIFGCRDRIHVGLGLVWSSLRPTGGGANQAQRWIRDTRISSSHHVPRGSSRSDWAVLVRLDNR